MKSVFDHETVYLNNWGKALVIVCAPVALAGAFIRVFCTELATAIWRACWEVRWEWRRVRTDFLR